jgi:hypothetical protein
MNGVRAATWVALAVLFAGCSAPAPQQRTQDGELAAVAPLKHAYPGLVMGFDIHDSKTLVVSLDLQQYIEADDDTIAAMKRAALARWRSAWLAAHPHEHGVLHVRFIDFIGRKVATEESRV